MYNTFYISKDSLIFFKEQFFETMRGYYSFVVNTYTQFSLYLHIRALEILRNCMHGIIIRVLNLLVGFANFTYYSKLEFWHREALWDLFTKEFGEDPLNYRYIFEILRDVYYLILVDFKLTFAFSKVSGLFIPVRDSWKLRFILSIRSLLRLRYIFYHKVYNNRFYRIYFYNIGVLKYSHSVVVQVPKVNKRLFNVYTFYTKLKTLILPTVMSISLVFILIDYYNINLIRQMAVWAVVGFLFFWLMSGFNFFLKRYRFGKFTSAIQRFWKRTNTYFWLIEGFLFCLFFYYYLNSSQEVYYFFDESNLNQNNLTAPLSFYFTTLPLLFLIIYSFYIMLNLPSFLYKQQVFHIKIISIVLVYIFLIECYQFYYVITLFSEISWDFENNSNSWSLTWRSPKIRVKSQYVILALIAKYWHFLFIFFSWLFLVLKSFEQRRLHYTLFGVNLQNCLLLLVLNLLFNINWIKWLFRRFYDTTYYWFFTDSNAWLLESMLNELFTFFLGF